MFVVLKLMPKGIYKHRKGWKHRKETKEKMSVAKKKNNPGGFKKGTIFAFKKGMTPWNKGKRGLQVAWNKGIKGLHLSPRTEFKKGNIPWMAGKHHKDSTKMKMSIAKKGKKQIRSEEGKRNFRQKMSGENAPNWKGGKKKEYIHYQNVNYKQWREGVFKRDNYTCISCKKKGYYLHPHHIESYTKFPTLRYLLDNGVTLCVPCHRILHSVG